MARERLNRLISCKQTGSLYKIKTEEALEVNERKSQDFAPFPLQSQCDYSSISRVAGSLRRLLFVGCVNYSRSINE